MLIKVWTGALVKARVSLSSGRWVILPEIRETCTKYRRSFFMSFPGSGLYKNYWRAHHLNAAHV